MEIDKRYVELLADVTPKNRPKKYARLGTLGFLIMLLGVALYGKGIIYGLGIMGAGVIIIGIGIVFQNKFEKKARQEFLEYYNRTGQLPPFHEFVKVATPKPDAK